MATGGGGGGGGPFLVWNLGFQVWCLELGVGLPLWGLLGDLKV